MRLVTIASAAVLALAPFASAFADNSDADDLLRVIKRARLIDLSHTWEITSPISSVNPPYAFELVATHDIATLPGVTPKGPGTRGAFGDGGQLSFTAEVMHFSGQHGAPTLDAIGHIGRNGLLFGGVDAAKSTSNPDGIGASGTGANLAVDNYPTDLLINRGVLLDVASMIQGDSSPLPEKYEITARHLRDAAHVQGVRLRRGDTVFIRTGWGQFFKGDPVKYKGDNSPGPGVDAAQYLIDQRVKVVGNDTLTFEQRPPLVFAPKFQVFPVHMMLIPDHGIYIIENLNLEELAEKRAYEFAVVVPPLKVKGGTGSALRAFALVPRDND